VIGLPDKLFFNTGIPTLIMEIKKSDTLLFADVSKEFEKRRKINVITDPHLNTIVSSVRLRKNIEKMTHIADIKEIKNNDYNLSIPRYVDTFEQEELPDMTDALLEMINDDMDRMSLETQVISLLEQMEGTSEEDRKLKSAIDQAKKLIRKRVKELEII
jgi:type I restriction enzyme M protein